MQIRSREAGLGLFVTVTLLASFVSAQSANPRIGSWKLKQEPPASNIMTYEPVAGGGMKVTVDSVSASGNKGHWTYTTMLDGKDAAITGYSSDTAAVTVVDAATNEIVYKKDGKVTQTATNVISADGRTITVTFKRTNAQGQPVTSVAIYEKQ